MGQDSGPLIKVINSTKRCKDTEESSMHYEIGYIVIQSQDYEYVLYPAIPLILENTVLQVII